MVVRKKCKAASRRHLARSIINSRRRRVKLKAVRLPDCFTPLREKPNSVVSLILSFSSMDFLFQLPFVPSPPLSASSLPSPFFPLGLWQSKFMSRTPPGGFIFVLAVCVVASEDTGPSETFLTLRKSVCVLCV